MAVKLGRVLVEIAADPRKLNKTLKGLSRRLRMVGRQVSSTGSSATAFVAPFVAGAALGVKAAADFDEALVNSTSVIRDLSGEMKERLGSVARETAQGVVFSATEMAESIEFLALAGLDANQIIASMPTVAAVATAGNFDLKVATDLLTDSQAALGLASEDAQENQANMARVADVLADASSSANASIEQFATSLTTKSGAALKKFGKEVEEGVAVLSVFANQGVKGSDAGTLLRQTLDELTIKASQNKKAFKDLNIEVFDADGDFKNLADVADDVTRAFGGMTDEGGTAAIQQLGFGVKTAGVISLLIDQGEEIRKLENQYRGSFGRAQEIADKRLGSFKNQFKLLLKPLKDVAIEIGKVLLPFLLGLSRVLKENVVPPFKVAIKIFQSMPAVFRNLAIGVILFAAVLGPATLALGVMISVLGALASPVTLAVLAIGSIVAVLVAVAIAFKSQSAEIRLAWFSLWEDVLALGIKAVGALSAISNLPGMKSWGVVIGGVKEEMVKLRAEMTGKATVAMLHLATGTDTLRAQMEELGLDVSDAAGLLGGLIPDSADVAADALLKAAEDAKALEGALGGLANLSLIPDLDENRQQYEDFFDDLKLSAADVGESFRSVTQDITRGFGDAFASAAVFGDDFGRAAEATGKQILARQLSFFAEQAAGELALFLFKEGLLGAELATFLGVKATEEAATEATTLKEVVLWTVAHASKVALWIAELAIFIGVKLKEIFISVVAAFSSLGPFGVALGFAAAAAAVAGVLAAISAFGDGAIVTGAQLAVVGEKGPEAIIPLSRLNEFMPQASGNTTVRIHLNDRAIAEASFRGMSGVHDLHLGNRGL